MNLTTKPKNFPKIAQKRMWSQLLKTNYSCTPTSSNKTEKHKSLVHTAPSLFAYAQRRTGIEIPGLLLSQRARSFAGCHTVQHDHVSGEGIEMGWSGDKLQGKFLGQNFGLECQRIFQLLPLVIRKF